MANLFGKNKLREIAQAIDTATVRDHIATVERWHHDYHFGTLRQDKETSREQEYNQHFFKEILGYKEKPSSPFNFEPKASTMGGQLPDAVVGYTDPSKDIENISAVVELKGASIPLDRPQRREGNLSPVQQGFKYKPLYRNCPFVIVSNFYEFRLYHDNQLDYELWTLDDLVNPDGDYLLFKTWYSLLRAENFIASGGTTKTEQLLSDIRIQQDEIGASFYKIYKDARIALLRDIYAKNELVRNDIDLGIEKAQTIIDRIVFAAFAEDRGLLPDNTLQRVVKAASSSAFGGSLWNTFKGFFEAIDTGSERLEIPDGYNGGLFRNDQVLNNLQISDEPLKAVANLGSYNFAEDLSVNILGHIFEQSITDLEEIKNKVNESQNLETLNISRRKKEGIFYTPDYIVRYIVDNSVGAYLRAAEEDLKSEFKLRGDIKDKTYAAREKKAYIKYRQVLQNIKVIDPACGSGAFLVYVFDYLLAENKRVSSILGGDIFSSELYIKTILQNNIYGVDLNEESVEITKLSLWLKSAQKGHQLTTLDNNIKCGNSLIDDEQIAGIKAFTWETAFPEIMGNGGFDVVVGNPPYVDSVNMVKNNPSERAYLSDQYATARGNWDLFVVFIEKGLQLLKRGGFFSMIIPNKLLSSNYAQTIRSYITSNYKLVGITDVSKEKVFTVAVYPVIVCVWNGDGDTPTTVRKGISETINIHEVRSGAIPENWALLFEERPSESSAECVHLGDWFQVSPAATVNEAYELKEVITDQPTAMVNKIINTGTIDPYLALWGHAPLNYIKGRYAHPFVDPNLLAKQKEWISKDKIIIAGMALRIEACFSNGPEFFPSKSTTVIYEKPATPFMIKSLLAIVNSHYFTFRFREANKHLSMAGGYMNINRNNLSPMPIPVGAKREENTLAQYATDILLASSALANRSGRFRDLLQVELSLISWPNKLHSWWRLEFVNMITGLPSKLSLSQKDQVSQLFDTYMPECRSLDQSIQTNLSKIDRLVYELYEVGPEEVSIIEGAFQVTTD